MVNAAKPTPAAVIPGAGVTLHAGAAFKLAFGYDAELRATARRHTVQAALKLRWCRRAAGPAKRNQGEPT